MTEEREEIHVNIGQVKVGKPGKFLKATLGSCLGIVFYWRERQIAGLAHCLLPNAPNFTTEIGAKYIDRAIPSLRALLKIPAGEEAQIEVRIFGGGNMMEQLARANPQAVGVQNIRVARQLLPAAGFVIRSEEVGGFHGRQIVLDCATGEVVVRALERSA